MVGIGVPFFRVLAATGLATAITWALTGLPAAAQQASTTSGGAPSSTGPTFPNQNSTELAKPKSTTTVPDLADSSALTDPQVADLPDPIHPGISQQGGRSHAQH